MNITPKIFDFFRIPLRIFTDVLFPKSTTLRDLEVMDKEKILEIVSKCGPIKNVAAGIGGVHALFQYRDHLAKQIVWEIKYRGNKKLVETVGKLMSEKILEIIGLIGEQEIVSQKVLDQKEQWIIVPIPASPRHLKERGFNQTQLIAQTIVAKNYFLYGPDILMKIKRTPSQASLSVRAERLSNLIGAYTVKNSENVCGKNIILIDDVITTGATMKEAKRVLADAGAKSVIGFAIAH